MWFIEKIINNKILVNLTFLGVLIFGILQFGFTPKSDTQNVDFGIFSIETKLPGASPSEIDQKITNKIEKELKDIDGITKYSSTSTSGFSQVFVWVDVDLNKTGSIFNEIKGAIGSIEFKSSFSISPEVRKLNWIGQPAFTVGVVSQEYNFKVHEMSKGLQKKIESLEGVKEVSSNTIRDPEISIELIPTQLKKNEISILEIINSLNKSYSFFMGGNIKTEARQIPILIKSRPDTLSKIREMIIRSNRTGKRVALKNLAKVRLKFPELKIKTRINGMDVIDLLVIPKPNSDIIKVRERVDTVIKKFSQYKVVVSSDLAKIVKNRFSVVKTNAISGLIIVFITLLFFINLKTTMWVVMGIPFSLLGTIGVMSLKGFMIDGLSMASIILILGIIVDDAIIVSEAVNQELLKNKSPKEAVLMALKNVMVPIITTLVTTLIAFFPMFLLTGTTGKFVQIVPWSIVAALCFSFLECIFILPGHLNQESSHSAKESFFSNFKNKLFDLMKNKTIKLTKLVIRYRYLTLLIGLFTLLLTGYVNIPKIKFKLFPNHRTERVIFQIKFRPNYTTTHKEKRIKLIEDILKKKTFISDFKTTINFFRNGKLDLYSYQMTSIDIILTPDRERTLNAKQIAESLLRQLKNLGISEISNISYTLISKNPPTGKDIEIRLIGDNDTEREKMAMKVERLLEGLSDVAGIENSARDKRENTTAFYDENEMNRIGISKENANITIQTALSGFKIEDVILLGKKHTLHLNLNNNFKNQSDFLKDLEVPSKKSTRLIPLGKILKLELKKEKIEIKRWKSDKITLITANINNGGISSSKVEERIRRKIKSPPSIRLRFGSTDGETEKSLMGLRFTTILAVLGIYTTLALLFQSYLQPLYVLSAIPMGLIGVMWGFQIHNEVYSFFSLLGVLGMMGVIVNDSLVLISTINDERTRGIQNYIAVATGKRIRAILLTTLTTVGGLLPLGLGIGGFDQYLSPMALSMGYGLLVGTPLIVVFIPVLYSIGLDFENLQIKTSRKWRLGFNAWASNLFLNRKSP